MDGIIFTTVLKHVFRLKAVHVEAYFWTFFQIKFSKCEAQDELAK